MIVEHLEESITERIAKFKGEEQRQELINISIEMLAAIKQLHDGGFLSQDIKDENFRYSNGKVKMLDFGLLDTYLNADNTHVK